MLGRNASAYTTTGDPASFIPGTCPKAFLRLRSSSSHPGSGRDGGSCQKYPKPGDLPHPAPPLLTSGNSLQLQTPAFAARGSSLAPCQRPSPMAAPQHPVGHGLELEPPGKLLLGNIRQPFPYCNELASYSSARLFLARCILSNEMVLLRATALREQRVLSKGLPLPPVLQLSWRYQVWSSLLPGVSDVWNSSSSFFSIADGSKCPADGNICLCCWRFLSSTTAKVFSSGTATSFLQPCSGNWRLQDNSCSASGFWECLTGSLLFSLS